MKNKLLRVWFTSIIIVIMAGCTSPTPAQNQYRLGIDAAPIKTDTKQCKNKTLKVEQAFGDKLYMSLKMYYVQGKYTQYAYARSRWAQSPNEKITQSITDYLRAMKLFKSVQNADSRTKNDFQMEINIEDFMQYFDENAKNSFVNVVITCNLIDEKQHKTVDAKTFHVSMKAPSNNARGGVVALNKALNIIVKECGLWLVGVCVDK